MRQDEHYDLSAWLDLARNLCPPERRAAMEEHAARCAACSETALFLEKLWQSGHGMHDDAVPEDWSEKAERILGERSLQPVRFLPVRPANLTFDSWSAGPRQQVRSGSSPARHMMYETADCALDLKLDEGAAAQDVLIVGQITDLRRPDRVVSNTPVVLLMGNKVLAATSSNEFGEFQLSCKRKRRMLISFPFEGSRVDVLLDRLLTEESHLP